MATPTLVPALTLKTDTETQFITINGTPYDLRHPSVITLSQQLWLERQVPRMGTLLAAMDDALPVAPDIEGEVDRILKRVASIAIDAPADVVDKLGPAQRMAVFHAFLGLPTKPGAHESEAKPKPMAAPMSTGRSKYQGFSGSTPAATRSRGGSGRRSS